VYCTGQPWDSYHRECQSGVNVLGTGVYFFDGVDEDCVLVAKKFVCTNDIVL
jgi:hypothetical protein